MIMDHLHTFASVFLHLDTVLGSVISTYGGWTYALLFVIVFCETGLIITPFLPGASLLFASGAFAALGSLNIVTVVILLWVAAVLGDFVNYWIGYTFGIKFFNKIEGRIIKREHLERTQAFYAKYGGRTIVFARFMPIVRTLAPFVAGMSKMSYRQFSHYNLFGAFAWVTILTLGGYFFGTIPAVKENFTMVILAIIFVSLVPVGFELVSSYLHRRQQVKIDSQT